MCRPVYLLIHHSYVFKHFLSDYIYIKPEKNIFSRFTIEKYSFRNLTHILNIGCVKNQSLIYFGPHFQDI
jgi:hypothetical protein